VVARRRKHLQICGVMNYNAEPITDVYGSCSKLNYKESAAASIIVGSWIALAYLQVSPIA